MRPAVLLVGVLILAVIASVCEGHAKLVTPTPWNSQPSKSAPCGRGSAASTPAAEWEAGSVVSLRWQVVAGDGTGALTMSIDAAGGTTFTTPVTFTGPVPSAVTFYNFNLTVPNVVCSAPNGLCTLRVKSSSNWYSCASVRITQTVPPPVPPTPPACAIASGLSYCAAVNGQNVLLPSTGASLLSLDAVAQQTQQANQFNPLVFNNGNNADCTPAYQAFICALVFPKCSTPAVSIETPACASRCQQTLNYCGVNATHQFLYECSSMPTDSDALGTCGSAPVIMSIVPRAGAPSGGYLVTVSGFSLGSGSDITTVTLGGIASEIVSQGVNYVVVRAGTSSGNLEGEVVVRSSGIGRSTSPLPFLFAGAPTVTSAVYGNHQLVVSFDIATNQPFSGAGNFSCAQVFDTVTADAIASQCYWASGSSLVALITAPAPSSIAFLPNVITNNVGTGGFVSAVAVRVVTEVETQPWAIAPTLGFFAVLFLILWLINKFICNRPEARPAPAAARAPAPTGPPPARLESTPSPAKFRESQVLISTPVPLSPDIRLDMVAIQSSPSPSPQMGNPLSHTPPPKRPPIPATPPPSLPPPGSRLSMNMVRPPTKPPKIGSKAPVQI